MRRSDICLASVPFGDAPGMKLRPVLPLTSPVGSLPEVLVAYISSVVPVKLLPSDLTLDPTTSAHASTNLKTVSVLRLHKLATIHASSIVRRIGTLPSAMNASISEKLRTLLEL